MKYTATVDLDDYSFDTEITYYISVPAQGKWADSDWDAMGYEEIEWNCITAFEYNEEGDLVPLTDEDKKSVVEQYSDRIEDKLLEEMREQEEDYYED